MTVLRIAKIMMMIMLILKNTMSVRIVKKYDDCDNVANTEHYEDNVVVKKNPLNTRYAAGSLSLPIFFKPLLSSSLPTSSHMH